ncbi:hypothetical protein RJ55_03817 [Drechmeria coniospora]|nr:hypothetical protein RJ55_03817 [Drechmeria coniospora]
MWETAAVLLSFLPLAVDATVTQASPGLPMVINTWGGVFTAATDTAFLSLRDGNGSALDAVQAGCAACERNQCDGTVGFGGSPDEGCETTLDAMIMDGTTFNVGAVAAIRRVKDAIAVARAVLEHTSHSMLAGDQATAFALEHGFREESLSTDASVAACEAWKKKECEPNFRLDGPRCRAYTRPHPASEHRQVPLLVQRDSDTRPRPSHDTISLVALHAEGHLAAGTSTNGAAHKIPGRVGDGPIAGSGAYVDSDAGGCGATGDGDILMRFLPCYQAVESLRRGMSPADAAADAVRRIVGKYPDVHVGLVVVDGQGRHAGAASGWVFTYAYRGGSMAETSVVTVQPLGKMGL